MVTVAQLYANTKAYLKMNGIEDYRFEAHCILEHAFCIRIHDLLSNPDSPAKPKYVNMIQAMIKKRLDGMPLQYILGEWEFYGLPFKVGNGVLIPRQDTETLVDYVIEYVMRIGLKNPLILDLCSGSGCIAVAAAKNIEGAKVYAVEFENQAFEYLKHNVQLNHAQVMPVKGDVLDENLAAKFMNVDIIIANPPYLTPEDMANLQTEVRFEPASALLGGDDGLLFYRKIPQIWHDSLNASGTMILESGIGQHNQIANALRNSRFSKIEFVRDLNGIVRVVAAS